MSKELDPHRRQFIGGLAAIPTAQLVGIWPIKASSGKEATAGCLSAFEQRPIPQAAISQIVDQQTDPRHVAQVTVHQQPEFP
jgi:hypothetical protein